jgi:propanol-preferring alcohol dehydrogenase
MSKTMQAAFVEKFASPLVLRETAIPTPGPGQILVKIEACGVCHTDLHAAKGDWPLKPTLPFTPGHEAIGLVTALGTGVTIVSEGDRVGVPWLYSACGHCEYCLSAWETVCGDAQFSGYTKNGGFAEYVVADPNYVAHVPAGLSARQAAPLICAGITTYKGLKQTEARAGEWVVISGAGGLGHLAIQYAKAMGLNVCAVDIDDGKLAHATKLGADLVVNASHGDPAAAVKKATSGGAHGVLITAPSLGAFKQGVGMTRKRGTCVLVGLPPGEFPVPLFDVVANCITIRGSFVGTREDMAETLAFAAAGQVTADIELQPLSAINTVFERLEHFQADWR